MALLPLLLLSMFRNLQRKKSQISVQVANGDHIVLSSQTDDICLTYTLEIISKCKKKKFKKCFFTQQSQNKNCSMSNL